MFLYLASAQCDLLADFIPVFMPDPKQVRAIRDPGHFELAMGIGTGKKGIVQYQHIHNHIGVYITIYLGYARLIKGYGFCLPGFIDAEVERFNLGK